MFEVNVARGVGVLLLTLASGCSQYAVIGQVCAATRAIGPSPRRSTPAAPTHARAKLVPAAPMPDRATLV